MRQGMPPQGRSRCVAACKRVQTVVLAALCFPLDYPMLTHDRNLSADRHLLSRFRMNLRGCRCVR